MKLIGNREKGYTLVSSFEKEKEPTDIPETNAEDEKTEAKNAKTKK